MDGHIELFEDVHYRVALTLGFTGLRASEALALTWADIDLETGLIRVRSQLSRKQVRVPLKTESANRTVPITDRFHRILEIHKQERFELGFAGAGRTDHPGIGVEWPPTGVSPYPGNC